MIPRKVKENVMKAIAANYIKGNKCATLVGKKRADQILKDELTINTLKRTYLSKNNNLMPPVQTANRNLNFRVTDDELNYLNFKAFQYGMTLTEYIKSRIIESDFVGQTSRPKASSYLKRAKTYDNKDWNKCGTISYNLWGGDEMLKYCKLKLNKK